MGGGCGAERRNVVDCGAERRNVVGCGAGTGGSRIPHIITTAIVTIDAAAKIAKHAPYISSVICIPIKVGRKWLYKSMSAISHTTAVLVVLIILIAIAAPYVLLIRIMDYTELYPCVYSRKERVSDAYDTLKTGDIVMHISSTHLPSTSGGAQIYYSHTSIVMKEGDSVYLSETSLGSEIMPSDVDGVSHMLSPGATISPLLTRLKYYTGQCFLMRLNRNLDPIREESLKAEAEYLCRNSYPYPRMRHVLTAILTGKQTGKRQCFQHVAHLLDTINLTPTDLSNPLSHQGFIRTCRIMCDLHTKTLPDGYKYSPPVELLYDIGTYKYTSDE